MYHCPTTFVSAWQHYLYSELTQSTDKNISALAVKSLKEVNYHLRYASDWTMRLGDGTEESHQRMQNAVNELWNFTGDLFEIDQIDEELLKLGIAADMKRLKKTGINISGWCLVMLLCQFQRLIILCEPEAEKEYIPSILDLFLQRCNFYLAHILMPNGE